MQPMQLPFQRKNQNFRAMFFNTVHGNMKEIE